jgi:hypothetical protein
VTSRKSRKLVATAGRTIDENAKRVLRALEEARQGRVNTNDPMVEQLKQCPEVLVERLRRSDD